MSVLFFACMLGLSGLDGSSSLCLSDGTAAGTRRILDREIMSITAVGDYAVVVSDSPGSYSQLWSFDTSGKGTKLPVPLDDFKVLGQADGKVYLRTYVRGSRVGITITDGTRAGTVFRSTKLQSNGTSIIPFQAIKHDDDIIFSAAYLGMWSFFKLPPTGKPVLLFQANAITPVGGLTPANSGDFAILGDKLIYRDFTRSTGLEPWVYDISTGTKSKLKEIYSGYRSSGVSLEQYRFVTANGRVYFTAENRKNGVELWSTDGTAAGTIIHEVSAGRTGAMPNMAELHAIDDQTVIWPALATTSSNQPVSSLDGRQIGITDGTTAGSRAVKPTLDGEVLTGTFHGMHPFSYDGKQWILNWWSTTNSSDVPATQISGLYTIDLATGATERVAKVLSPGQWFGSAPWTAVMDGTLYFSGAKSCSSQGGGFCNNEPWVSDGTAAGTRQLLELNRLRDATFDAPLGSNPYRFTVVPAQ